MLEVRKYEASFRKPTFNSTQTPNEEKPAKMTIESEDEWEVEKILDHKIIRGKPKYKKGDA
jgi:hypothetical protein